MFLAPHFKASQKLAMALLLAATVIVGFSTVYRAALGEKSRSDITVYLRAAEAIPQQENIYAVENSRHWHYVYLPLLAILLVPVTALPLWLNALLWYLVSIAALVGVWRGLAGLFQNHGDRFGLIFACLIVALPPLLNTLTRGQLGTLSLYLTLLPFLLAFRGKNFGAGFVLGFAIILKMSPLLILPFYFLLQKNWKALLGCAAGGIVFGILLPMTVFGPELFLKYLRTYFETMGTVTSDQAHQSYLWGELFTPFAGDNQSFYAVLTRLYWKTEAAFIGNSNAGIRMITGGLLGLLLALPTVLYLKTRAPSLRHNFTVYALFSCVMLLTSPVSQIHHFTPLMFLAAAAFLQFEKAGAWGGKVLGVMTFALVAFVLGMILDGAAFIGLPLWGTLALWLAVFFSERKISQESARL